VDTPAVVRLLDAVREHLELDALAGEHGRDQLVEAGGDHRRPMSLGELVQTVSDLDVLDDPRDHLGERGRDRRELERDLLVQRQVVPDARLELGQDRGIAEAVDHLDERVADGDGAVPVEHQPHGTSSSFPVVRRDSRSSCARRASSSG